MVIKYVNTKLRLVEDASNRKKWPIDVRGESVNLC